MSRDVVARMRAMADDVYSSTEAALYREGANEVDRLTRELDAAEAQARGAQYREREARNEAAMLRAALDDLRSTPDAGDLAGLGARAVR